MRHWILAAAIVFLGISCGGDPTAPPGNNGPTVAQVLVSPATEMLSIGKTSQASATAVDEGGASITGRTISWTTSSALVATVSSSGLVTGVGAGPVTITATADGKSGSASYTIVDGSIIPASGGTAASIDNVAKLVVPSGAVSTTTVIAVKPAATQPTSSLLVGSAYELTPSTVTFATPATFSFTYSTLPSGVAASSLKLYAFVGGQWQLVAGQSLDEAAKTIAVPLTTLGTFAVFSAAPVATVTVAPATGTVNVGATTTLTAATKDASNNALTGRTIAWSSSAPAIATVDATTGVVTGVAVGSATITATVEGKTGTATITVSNGTPVGSAGGTITSADALMTLVIPANALQANTSITVGTSTGNTSTPFLIGTGYDIGPAATTFSSQATLSIRYGALPAGVTESALRIYKLVNGQWQLLPGQSQDAAGDKISAPVTTLGLFAILSAPPVAMVSLTSPTQQGSATITVGSTVQVTATLRDASGAQLNGRVIDWTTSNAAAATVSAEGLVAGVAVGSATITATSEGKQGTFTVTVNPVPPTPVASVNVGGNQNVLVGNTTALSAIAYDASNAPINGAAFTWASSNNAAATVSSTGVVTAVAVGSATITATSGGRNGTLVVTVVAGSMTPTRRWVGGNSAGPSSWGVAANWAENSLPGTTDTVLVPAAAVVKPVLSSDVTISALAVENGATVDISTFILNVANRIEAIGAITGSGTVRMVGQNEIVRGTFPSLTMNTGSVIGPTNVNGNFTVVNNVDMTNQSVTVSGNVTGNLHMRSATSALTVTGTLALTGIQTAGTIRAAGKTTVSLTAGSTTLVTLNGTTQDVAGTYQDLQVNSTSGVTFNATVRGSATVANAITIAGGTLTVHGDLTTPVGSTVTTNTVSIRGKLQASGRFSPGKTIFAGTGAQSIPTGADYLYKDVDIESDAALTGGTTVSGSLTTTTTPRVGSLNVGGFTLTVVNNLSAKLTMENAAGVVGVLGNAAVSGSLKTGLVRVAGNVTRYTGSSGTHRTILNGTAAQQAVSAPGTEGLTFQELDVAGTAGISVPAAPAGTMAVLGHLTVTGNGPMALGGDLTVKGNFKVDGSPAITGPGITTVLGSLTLATGATFTQSRVNITGALTAVTAYTAGTTDFRGGSATSPQVINSGAPYTWRAIVLSGLSQAVAGNISATSIDGSSGIFDVNGKSVTVSGSVSLVGTLLRMKSATGALTVGGHMDLYGYVGSSDGEQSAGTISVAGNFSGGTGWTPTGTQKLILTGATVGKLQSLASTASLQELQVTGTDSVYVNGVVSVRGNMAVDNNAVVMGWNDSRLTVSGSLTGVVGAIFEPRLAQMGTGVFVPRPAFVISLGGVLDVKGKFTPDTTVFTGVAQNVPGGTNYQYRNVRLSGGEAKFVGLVGIANRLIISQGSIGNVNGAALTVATDIVSLGILRMKSVADSVNTPAVTFAGTAKVTGEQTAGKIVVTKTFIGGGAWAPSGTHKAFVRGFVGDTARFQDLDATGAMGIGTQVTSLGSGTDLKAITYVNGNFALIADSLIGSSIQITGNATIPVALKVKSEVFSIAGVLGATGTNFSPATTVFAGSGQMIPVGPVYRNVTISGPLVTLSNPAIIQGRLTITASGVFDLNGKSQTVSSFQSEGLLRMKTAGGILSVNGAATFLGTAPAAGEQTIGEMRVRGNFDVTGSSTSFAPSGTFRSTFDGGALQSVTTNGASFLDVTTNNAAGVILNSTTVNGSLTASQRTVVPASSVVHVVKDLTVSAGGTLVNDGAITYSGTYTNSGTLSGNAPTKKP